MRRAVAAVIEAQALRGAQSTRFVAVLWTLCAVLLCAALGACASDRGEAELADAPTEPVSQIESSDGPLLLSAPPAASTIDDDVLDSAARGVVAVRARGCGPVANGTAFAVAPGLLVGAAHVVAGAPSVEIEWSTSESTEPSRHLVDVVGYEEDSDLALFRTESGVPPLSIDQAQLGTNGAVLGFERSSEFVVSPARIEHYVSASGLWGQETTRSVYVLAVDIRKGQSGGPLIDQDGSVVGVVFAAIQGPQDIGFALSREELVRFLISAGIDARVNDRGETVIAAQPARLEEVPHGECRIG